MGSAEAAELTKLAETTYRDVNIALANEFARFADRIGVDVERVIDAANSQPFSHIHRPGIAVGGHCIPVYPRFLLAGDPEAALPAAARAVNEAMPAYAVARLAAVLGELARATGADPRGELPRRGQGDGVLRARSALREELPQRGREPARGRSALRRRRTGPARLRCLGRQAGGRGGRPGRPSAVRAADARRRSRRPGAARRPGRRRSGAVGGGGGAGAADRCGRPSRPARRVACAPVKSWTPEQVAAAAGARLIAVLRRPGTADPTARWSTPARPGRERCSSGSRARTSMGVASRPQALAAGAWGVLVADAHGVAAASGGPGDGGVVLACGEPLRSLQRLATAWRRAARRPGDRHHRLDRQDLDQGPDPGPDRPAARGAGQPGELQHRDRAAAGDPRRPGGHRGARAGDGDARPGSDRRARPDRRARRGGDRLDRAGPPRAARQRGGDRGGQGGADHRPASPAAPRSRRPARRCSRPTSAATSRTSPSARAATSAASPPTATG